MEELLKPEQWETYRKGIVQGDCRIVHGKSTWRWAESKGLAVRWKKTYSLAYGVRGAISGATVLPFIVAGPLYLWQGDLDKLFSYLWEQVGVLPILGVVALGFFLGLGLGILSGRTQAYKRSFYLWLAENEEMYKAAIKEGGIEIWLEPGKGVQLTAVDDL